MSIKLGQAILAINKDAKYAVRENTFPIEWMDGTTPIAEADITAKQIELQADYDAKAYQRKRQPEYPAIGEQLDLLWHAIDDGTLDKTSDFYTSLKATKDKYPKT